MGNIVLGVFLLLFGASLLGLAIPPVVLGLVAIIAGILLLVGR